MTYGCIPHLITHNYFDLIKGKQRTDSLIELFPTAALSTTSRTEVSSRDSADSRTYRELHEIWRFVPDLKSRDLAESILPRQSYAGSYFCPQLVPYSTLLPPLLLLYHDLSLVIHFLLSVQVSKGVFRGSFNGSTPKEMLCCYKSLNLSANTTKCNASSLPRIFY